MSVESVREKIQNAALELFSQKGYDGTSIDEIAAASGMKAPNIYKYFKGKQEIFETLNNEALKHYKRRMSMTPDSLVWIHNAEELKTFSLHQLVYTVKDETVRKYRRMYTIEQYRNMQIRASQFQLNNIMAQFKVIFEGLIKLGEIPECDVEMLTMEYCSPVSLLIQLCDRDPELIEETMVKIEKYIDFFIEKNFIKK